MGRYAHFKANTGWGGIWRTALIHAVVPYLVIGAALAGEAPWTLGLAAVGAWLVPFVLRGPLTARPRLTQIALSVFALALLGVALVGGSLREHVDDTLLLFVVTTALSGYISAYWWFFSDPEIVREGATPDHSPTISSSDK